MPAGRALPQANSGPFKDRMRFCAAGRAFETPGPARSLHRRLAGTLTAVALEESKHGQAGLELNTVHRHGVAPMTRRHNDEPSQAHHVSLAEDQR